MMFFKKLFLMLILSSSLSNSAVCMNNAENSRYNDDNESSSISYEEIGDILDNTPDRQKSEQLLHSIKWNYSDNSLNEIEALLKGDSPASPNYQDLEGNTSLFKAAYHKNHDLRFLKLLVEYKADPNILNNDKRTPIRWAAWYGNIEMASLLIEKNAELNIGDFQGYTPLHTASTSASKADHEFIELLLKHKADPNTKTTDQSYSLTPLHLLSSSGNSDQKIQVLLNYGADPTIKNKNKCTPLDYAVSQSQFDNVKVLLNHMESLLNPTKILEIMCTIDSNFRSQAHAFFYAIHILQKKMNVKIPRSLLFFILLLEWTSNNPDHYLTTFWHSNQKQFIKDWVNNTKTPHILEHDNRAWFDNYSIEKVFEPYRDK